MEIRAIQRAELSGLLELYAQLHPSDDPLPSESILAAAWQQIQQDPNLQYFGIFIAGALVSTCNIAIIPNLTRACRPFGVIENVVTARHCRGQGLGKLVLQAALDFAWKRNCYKVMLMTGRLDESTFRFYESAGFLRNEKRAFIARNPHGESRLE